jgi:predicted enzyme related to lactoylglutathione lyase
MERAIAFYENFFEKSVTVKDAELKIVFPLKTIGENWVSEFEDSEGNHIEVTAPISTAK